MAGILLDRRGSPDVHVWAIVAIGLLAAALWAARRSRRVSTIMLLGACVAVGGMRHHLAWSTLAADDVGRLATTDPQLIRVVGVIETPVTILPAEDSAMTPPWMQIDRSMCNLGCEQVVGEERTLAVSGTARLIVTGHLLHVGVGDRVEVVGTLTAPGRPTNPGGFDYRQYLQREGVRCLVECDHPEGVRMRNRRITARLARWRSELRSESEEIILRHLDQTTAPLASALLLGERSQLPEDVRSAFAQSGTMHLLAISGLHVGILAGLLLVAGRWLNLSVTATTLVLLLGVGAYAFVTNLRPPVIRASVLVLIAAAGWPAHRRPSPVNLLSACALVVLLIQPADLFDTGTQLSFLAVIAIGWAGAFISQQRSRADETLWRRLLVKRGGAARMLVRLLAEGYVVTTAIWLFTLPLTAARFHIAAPVGFVINVLMIPYVTVVLGLGFCTLACGLLLPWIVRWPALLFNLSLGGLLDVVETASDLNLGHVYAAGPPDWWLAVFYGLLALVLVLRRSSFAARWGWTAVWGWVIVGQLTAFMVSRQESLRCTFLDVGHGCCVLIELPDGTTFLYDAGKFAGDRRGRQIIQSALWARGVRHIDGIVTSHADVDHFNAAAGLMKSLPVGTLLCSRSFLDFEQEPVAILCETAAECQIPIRLLHAGDRLATARSGATLNVLHPDDGWQSAQDNANSVVVRLDYAGRSLLLTGDLEGDGLAKLLRNSGQDVDILLAPHHGSRPANPAALGAWAVPEFVIISGGNSQTAANLHSSYPRARRIFSTAIDGAVTVEIQPDSQMRLTAFLDGRTDEQR